jgi:DcaP outer membrane protein
MVVTMCVVLAVSPHASAQIRQPVAAQDLDTLKQRLADP